MNKREGIIATCSFCGRRKPVLFKRVRGGRVLRVCRECIPRFREYVKRRREAIGTAFMLGLIGAEGTAVGPGGAERVGPASQPGRAQVGSAGRGPAGEGDDGE